MTVFNPFKQASVFDKYEAYLKSISLSPSSVLDELTYIRKLYQQLNDDLLLRITTDKAAEDLVKSLSRNDSMSTILPDSGRIYRKRAWSQPSEHKCRKALKRFFYWAYEWERILSGLAPYQNAPSKKGPKPEPKFLLPQEITKIYGNPFLSIRDALAVRLFYVASGRRTAMSDVRVGDIDFKTRMIRYKKTKGDKWLWVKIDKKTCLLLRFYIDGLKAWGHGGMDDPILPAYKKWTPVSSHRLYKVVRTAGEKAGIHAYPHKLRHSTARSILKNGGTIAHVKRHLGHSSESQALQYTHLIEDDVKPYINRL